MHSANIEEIARCYKLKKFVIITPNCFTVGRFESDMDFRLPHAKEIYFAFKAMKYRDG